MNRPAGQQLYLGIAVLALLAGVVVILQALIALPADLHRLDRKAHDLATLRRIAADWNADKQAILPFEALPSKRPVSLSELATKTLPGVTPLIRQRDTLSALAGWRARRTEVKCETSATALGNFLLAAENARPPWRLVEFNLTAAAATPDAVRAVLVLEALEKP